MIVESLRVFVTVVEQKNFSRAAEVLHLSQPGVSLQIRNLEHEFGTKLIHRTPKLVKLTQAGEILYEQARQILQLYQHAKQEIDLLHNTVTGTLKIGASFTIGEYVLPHLLAEYAAQYPHVEIDVKIANTEEVSQAVRSSQIDIGLIEGDVSYKDISIKPFMKDEMLIVVPFGHPLTKKQAVTIDDMQNQVWVLRESGSGTRSYSDRLIEEYDLTVKRSYVFSSSQGVKEAVIAGLGIAVVSAWIVRKELAANEIAAISLKGKRFFRTFSILLPPQPPTKSLEVFLQKLDSAQTFSS